MTRDALKGPKNAKTASTKLRWKLRSSGKRRGIHLACSDDDRQTQHPNKEGGNTSYNVYHRKNQHRVMPDPKIYIDDSQEHTTPRSNRGCSTLNVNDSAVASRNSSVNRVHANRRNISEDGAANIQPDSAEAEEQNNEANMLFFNNQAEDIPSMQAPTFNLLSVNDTANGTTNEAIPPPAQPTDKANECGVRDDVNHMEKPSDIQLPQRKSRRGRGRTKMKSKGRREAWEPKIQLEFDEEGKVCSDNATTFANLCGYYVRKHAPLQLKSWENVPTDALALIFKKIMHHYCIPNDMKIKANILKSCAKKYRAYRSYLKRKYFDRYATNEERLQNIPPNRMSKEDWEYLVNHFESSDFQERSKRNKRNRDHQQCYQTLGTCSIARVKNKMRKDGADSVRYRAYKKARLRANGEPINMQAKEIMENIETLARDKGVDLDTAMDMVIPKRKRRDFTDVLESVGLASADGVMDVVAQRSQARAVNAEKMALDAQREAVEAKKKVEMLQMQLADSRQADKGKRRRTSGRQQNQSTRKKSKCYSSKRELIFDSPSSGEEPSNSDGYDDAFSSEDSEDDEYCSEAARKRQLDQLSSMKF